jgi:hypothetical protein
MREQVTNLRYAARALPAADTFFQCHAQILAEIISTSYYAVRLTNRLTSVKY